MWLKETTNVAKRPPLISFFSLCRSTLSRTPLSCSAHPSSLLLILQRSHTQTTTTTTATTTFNSSNSILLPTTTLPRRDPPQRSEFRRPSETAASTGRGFWFETRWKTFLLDSISAIACRTLGERQRKARSSVSARGG